MTSFGPIIEELPDDFDVQAEKASAAESRGGAMRKGFFSPKPKVSAHAAPSKPAPAASSQAPSVAAECSAVAGAHEAAMAAARADAREANPEVASEVDEAVAGLRARLLKASGDARKARRQSDVAECTESLKQTVAAVASQPRWPSSQARAARDRAARDADAALAELRGASNDARRMRSGEEKRVLAELRRAADDGVDRVKKLCESVAPKDKTPESEARVIVAAFHALPFTAKLQLLIGEKVAAALLAASFLLGVALMSGILLEVYVAWECGFQCER